MLLKRVGVMRIALNKDKLEQTLNSHRPDSWLSFPPRGTAPAAQISAFAALKHSFVFPTLFCLFVPVLWVALSVVITTDLSLRLYHHVRAAYIYQITLSVLKVYFGNLLIALPLLLIFNAAIYFSIRWAWNRRAERLNRKGMPPPSAPACDPVVWPPPPSRPKPF